MNFQEWLEPRLKDAVQKNGVGTVAEITGVNESTIKRALLGVAPSTDNGIRFINAFGTSFPEIQEVIRGCFPHIADVFATMNDYQKQWNGTPEGLNEEIRGCKIRYKINSYACLGEGLPLKRGKIAEKWGGYGIEQLDRLIGKGYLIEQPTSGNITSAALTNGKQQVSTSDWQTIYCKMRYDMEEVDIPWCEPRLVGAITHQTGLTSTWGMKKLRESAIRFTAEVNELKKDERFKGDIAFCFNIQCGLLDKDEKTKLQLSEDLDEGK